MQPEQPQPIDQEILIFAGPVGQVETFAAQLRSEYPWQLSVGPPAPDVPGIAEHRPLGQLPWDQIAITILLNVISAEIHFQIRDRVRTIASERGLKPKNDPSASNTKKK